MDIYFFYLIILFCTIIGYLWNRNNYYECLILDLSNDKKKLQTIISNKNTEITELTATLLKQAQQYKEFMTYLSAGARVREQAQMGFRASLFGSGKGLDEPD
jgi:hypothetical protein